jgi:hypothetical protein
MDGDDVGLCGSERPIAGPHVLGAFDRALVGAHGATLALVGAYLDRAGIGRGQGVRPDARNPTVTAAETEPAEGEILGAWAGSFWTAPRGEVLHGARPFRFFVPFGVSRGHGRQLQQAKGRSTRFGIGCYLRIHCACGRQGATQFLDMLLETWKA